ncbi:MAG: hypothetical protein A2Y40_09185 [Candidatus Margulisbacteria bacterium GWF2_35_9]|nr:MAG: hypothetical protein A2Y40_09185 [Candidatus Margulisbacteria bacterium GWF2_35_9]
MKYSKQELKNIALAWSAFTLLISIWPIIFSGHGVRLIFLYLSVFFLVVAFTIPHILAPLYFIWIKLGRILGYINSRIILTLFYVIFIVPTGVVMNLFQKDLLKKKINQADSYWEDRPIQPGSMQRQF